MNLLSFVTRYYLKLRCANCGEVPDRWQYITLSESQSVKERRIGI